MRLQTSLPWITSLITLLMVGVATEATGQEFPAPPPAAEIELSDAELENFAYVYLEVQEIGFEHQNALAAAASPEEAQALQERAQAQMAATVEDHGFAPEEYASIVETLNVDEELRVRFTDVLNDLLETADP